MNVLMYRIHSIKANKQKHPERSQRKTLYAIRRRKKQGDSFIDYIKRLFVKKRR